MESGAVANLIRGHSLCFCEIENKGDVGRKGCLSRAICTRTYFLSAIQFGLLVITDE